MAIRARAAANLADGRLPQVTAAEADKSRAHDAVKEAKAKTEHALHESEASRAQAEGVSNYLVESFRKPDPWADGRTLKVVDLLDQAMANLDERFAGAPRIMGLLLNARGETYRGLGLPNQAAKAHQKAGALFKADLGADHRDTHNCGINIATLYVALSSGWNHAETLESRSKLLEAYQRLGEHAQAELLLRDEPADAAAWRAKLTLSPDRLPSNVFAPAA